ncbi:hypothetical protein Ae201684P_015194 [Aphanomyces euteiches]|nr:hypothetical protein Ae201684P_015194 [Aphanomyces euteiches]
MNADEQEVDIQRKLSYSAALPVSKPGDKIYVRLRPTSGGDSGTFQILSDTCLLANPPRTSRVTDVVSSFHFSQVFKAETTQRELFEQTTDSIIQEAFDGKNGLVFAYGVTNSGKTYTILGTPENPGILPETFEALFKKSEKFKVTASYLEIYNEKVFDLLAVGPRRIFLQLLEKDGRVFVKDLEERGAKTGASGLRLQEASKINGSLMNLNRCLETLRYNQLHPKSERPVPFRSSKLTRLFQESLTGMSKQAGRIIMIVAVNPSTEEFDETLRTLQYSAIAKEVVTAPSKVISRRPSVLRQEYGTDGHKKRKRPSIKDAAPKPAFVPLPKERPSIRTRNSIVKGPVPLARDRIQNRRDSKLNEATPSKVRTKPKVQNIVGPVTKKQISDDEVALLREEIEQLKEELQAKEVEYVQQEVQVRRELVNELNKQLDSLKASYEIKLDEMRAELDAVQKANRTLVKDKAHMEGLCEKLQEQIDECEDEIRRIEARHAEELLEFQTF